MSKKLSRTVTWTYQNYDRKERNTTIGMPKLGPIGPHYFIPDSEKIDKSEVDSEEGSSSEVYLKIGDYSCKKAPPVTKNLYEEVLPMLFASDMAYTLTEVLTTIKEEEIKVTVPEEYKHRFEPDFLKRSIDFAEKDKNDTNDMNNKNGLSLDVILEMLDDNKITIEQVFKKCGCCFGGCVSWGYEKDVIEWLMKNRKIAKQCFLTHHRYLSQDDSCVYSIYKDTINKRVVVTFRGSVGLFSTRDWETNLNIRPTNMWTPSLIAHKMEGEFKKNMIVHEGFYKYLFANEHSKGAQRYDQIISDLKEIIADEKGYSVYVTGHSLGAALATMFSMKIAGCGLKQGEKEEEGEEGDNRQWLPRPITCITIAAPRSGSASYRTAVELLEQHGLLRSLRINVSQDIVPTIPPFSISCCGLSCCGLSCCGRPPMGLEKHEGCEPQPQPRPPMGLEKHVGMNLRLTRSGYDIEHSSKANIWTAFRNSMFKLVCCFPCGILKWHGLEECDTRLDDNKEELKKIFLDDLYCKEDYVSKNFIDGKQKTEEFVRKNCIDGKQTI